MNNKNLIITTVGIIIIILISIFIFLPKKPEEPKTVAIIPGTSTSTRVAEFDPKNETYIINNVLVKLTDGQHILEADGTASSSEMVTAYFGNEAVGDINGDGITDKAYLITRKNSSPLTSYYAVVAVGLVDGYKITNAYFIGDGIAPDTTEIDATQKIIIVNYAVRKPNEPISESPSVATSLRLQVDQTGRLIQAIPVTE